MSTDQARGTRPGPDPSTEPGRAWLVITILALCGTIVSLQQTMLLPLLPELPDLVGTSAVGASWMGAVLLSAALTLLLVAASQASSWGWVDLRTVAAVATGIAILIVWVPLERRVRHPLVDLRTAMDRPVLIANAVSLLMVFWMFVNMLVTT